jgi:hypothetical protein
MTWLSQLLPKGSNVQQRTRHDRGGPIPMGKGRRRIMFLESLERRMVMSNVTALFSSGVLTITGDIHNDNFSITETVAGQVTVASTSPQTTIDLTHLPYNTPGAVTSIKVILPGTVNFDNVALKGPGKTTATKVNTVAITATGANLTFTASGVDNTGSFTLSNTVGLPGGLDAALHASVDNSTFASLTITQTGNAPAYVELGNDNIISGASSGPVTVSEGVANADNIILDKLTGGGDTLGSTTLTQGAGPAFAGANATADSASISNAQVTNLTIDQLLNGNGDSITANTVAVALASFGVVTTQGNGSGDTATFTGVTSPFPSNPNSIGPKGPPSILTTQGNGNGDSASATSSQLAGNITLKQGNGNGDSALISGVTVGFKITSGGKTMSFYGNLTINQGTGKGDTAAVKNSSHTGVITIT